MTRKFLSPWSASVLLAVVLASHSAYAQYSPNDITISTFDPASATAPISAVEGPGVKIGEGTTIYPVFGLSTGVVNNVFYQDENVETSGVLRMLAQVGVGSLNQARLQRTTEDGSSSSGGSFQYRAEARASYDFMLSGDSTVRDTGGLGLGIGIRGLTNPDGRLSFGFDEQFMRLIRAANFETDANTNRDINNLGLKLIYHPQDRTVSGYIYYNNTIDIFERDTQSFADRFQHRFGIHPQWRWLPQTTIYADVSMGAFTGLGADSTKVSSFPLVALAGISTLLSLKTTLNFQAGYENGFYSAGPSYSAPLLGASVGYRYSPLGRVVLTYDWTHQDSINANFYRDHVIRLWWQQLFVPFVVMVQPEVHLRQYNGIDPMVGGPPTRDDFILSVIGGIHYNFRNWLAATLDYHFTTVQSDYRYMTDGIIEDPSFTRHELLFGFRLAM